jgi:hypothetical protein
MARPATALHEAARSVIGYWVSADLGPVSITGFTDKRLAGRAIFKTINGAAKGASS